MLAITTSPTVNSASLGSFSMVRSADSPDMPKKYRHEEGGNHAAQLLLT